MKQQSLKTEKQSRRKFTGSLTAAFVVSPIVSAIDTGGSVPPQSAKPKPKNPKGQEKKAGPQGVFMEHIPPTRIVAGSCVVETVKPIGGDGANTGTGSIYRKRKRVIELPKLTGVRVINIDGACLFNGYDGTHILNPPYVPSAQATIEIWLRDKTAPQGDIAVKPDQAAAKLKVESDKALGAAGPASSPYAHKVKHPDNLTIKKVVIRKYNAQPEDLPLYEGYETDEILLNQVLIW